MALSTELRDHSTVYTESFVRKILIYLIDERLENVNIFQSFIDHVDLSEFL